MTPVLPWEEISSDLTWTASKERYMIVQGGKRGKR
jgi:hypothetical protein